MSAVGSGVRLGLGVSMDQLGAEESVVGVEAGGGGGFGLGGGNGTRSSVCASSGKRLCWYVYVYSPARSPVDILALLPSATLSVWLAVATGECSLGLGILGPLDGGGGAILFLWVFGLRPNFKPGMMNFG